MEDSDEVIFKYTTEQAVEDGVLVEDEALRTAASVLEQSTAKFRLGKIVATPGVLERVELPDYVQALARHARGDWGDVCAEDKALNDRALIDGTRLLSAYHTPGDTEFWIITEADRSSTCILLPSEY